MTRSVPDDARPVPDDPRPAPGDTRPVPDVPRPTPDGTRPVPDGTRSVADDTPPVADVPRPTPGDTPPVPGDTPPVSDDTRPVADDPRPVPDDPHLVRGFRAMTVQGWFLLALALMTLLVVAGSVVGGQVLAHTARVSDQLLQRIQPAQGAAFQLQAAVLNQETGARGYAIAADPQFLQPYSDGRRGEAQLAATLRGLVGDRPVLRADLDAVERATADWRGHYAEPMIKAVTPGVPRPPDKTLVEGGKARFDHLRALFRAQNTHLAEERSRAQRELAEARTERDWVLGGLVAAFLITGVVLAVLIRQLVTRPLDRLRTASYRVAGGDFEHRITAHGPADLRAVARDVEGMRRRIVTELGTVRSAHRLLVEQTADLDAQAVELRRSNAELEQFAYVASHDLQEPLRKVASFCQLLEKRYGDSFDERGKQYLDFAVDGAKRMQVLINDLLTFSRVGRLNDASVPVALDAALDKAVANLGASIEESGARIERPERLPEIIGDPMLMVMLWQNLLGNAVKFRRPDEPPLVRLTCERRDGDWLLAVSDNGIGVPTEFAEKVFVIFQRLHGRDSYSGTGIGLALCKKIVEHHGGRIWIDTGYGTGARFCLTLPAETPPEDAPPEDAPSADVPAVKGNPA
ncbi:sensor histidine kinase [Streptantibioticus cattleyicolor]|uniref:histidine kinase n=1 Tax=Streptantibioticus cattleyicolor (strain ATCC 35852 / DSM 46488 / JCM 4925 / NBRC 14057 / NRRL 8057) TaxID=1003195 RepID=F8JJS6_STREN|nr:sensor histidine kinase [Streptantibioticus cattleyicolor]AEW98647.1 two-component sensor protein [Streptantibioticus cattleyicolor NRRL 8057 = DSM 46488]CCB72293.1 Sensor protein [Streptantibioticus cattleyicolor NRRL 8057 = DSM 46488]